MNYSDVPSITPAGISVNDLPAKILSSNEAKNKMAWVARPLRTVGSEPDLSGYTKSIDVCVLNPMLAQRYTSYSCLPIAYICSVEIEASAAQQPEPIDEAVQTEPEDILTVPSAEILKKQPAIIQKKYQSGAFKYYSVSKFCSEEAYELKKMKMPKRKNTKFMIDEPSKTTSVVNLSTAETRPLPQAGTSTVSEQVVPCPNPTPSDKSFLETRQTKHSKKSAKRCKTIQNELAADEFMTDDEQSEAEQSDTSVASACASTTGAMASQSVPVGNPTMTAVQAILEEALEMEQAQGARDKQQPKQQTFKCYAAYLPLRYVLLTFTLNPFVQEDVSFDPAKNYSYTIISEGSLSFITSGIIDPSSVSDSITLIDFTNALRNDTGGTLDVAPLVRLLLLHYSLFSSGAEHDITCMQFLKNVKSKYIKTKICTPSFKPREYEVLAMPIDTYISFISGVSFEPNVPNTFRSNAQDIDWIAIPVVNGLASSPFFIQYVSMYLDSGLTWGTVNHFYKFKIQGSGKKVGRFQTMPAANTTHIRGPKKAILVLIQQVSQMRLLSLPCEGCNIPIFRGNCTSDHDVRPVDWSSIWVNYYNNNNLNEIRMNIFRCWDYVIRESVSESVPGLALSHASEFISAWRQGMYVSPSADNNRYDLNLPLKGAHVIGRETTGQEVPLTQGSKYKAVVFNPFDRPDVNKFRSMIHGFNNSAISTDHQPINGLQSVIRNSDTGVIIYTERQPGDKNSAPHYTLQVATSIKRIAMCYERIRKFIHHYSFSTPSALSSCIHMLAIAQSANMAAFLSQQGVSARDWAGFSEESMSFHNSFALHKMKESLGLGLHKHTCLAGIVSNWGLWDDADISTYYGAFEPFVDRDWLSHSPVPCHLTMQWLQKLKLKQVPNIPVTLTLVIGTIGIKINRENQQDKLFYTSSFNTAQYHPIVLDMSSTSNSVYKVRGSWIEQYQYLSNTSCGSLWGDRTFTETTTHTVSPVIHFDTPHKHREMYVLESAMATSVLTKFSISEINYPHTLDFESIITNAKNYLICPSSEESKNSS